MEEGNFSLEDDYLDTDPSELYNLPKEGGNTRYNVYDIPDDILLESGIPNHKEENDQSRNQLVELAPRFLLYTPKKDSILQSKEELEEDSDTEQPKESPEKKKEKEEEEDEYHDTNIYQFPRSRKLTNRLIILRKESGFWAEDFIEMFYFIGIYSILIEKTYLVKGGKVENFDKYFPNHPYFHEIYKVVREKKLEQYVQHWKSIFYSIASLFPIIEFAEIEFEEELHKTYDPIFEKIVQNEQISERADQKRTTIAVAKINSAAIHPARIFSAHFASTENLLGFPRPYSLNSLLLREADELWNVFSVEDFESMEGFFDEFTKNPNPFKKIYIDDWSKEYLDTYMTNVLNNNPDKDELLRKWYLDFKQRIPFYHLLPVLSSNDKKEQERFEKRNDMVKDLWRTFGLTQTITDKNIFEQIILVPNNIKVEVAIKLPFESKDNFAFYEREYRKFYAVADPSLGTFNTSSHIVPLSIGSIMSSPNRFIIFKIPYKDLYKNDRIQRVPWRNDGIERFWNEGEHMKEWEIGTSTIILDAIVYTKRVNTGIKRPNKQGQIKNMRRKEQSYIAVENPYRKIIVSYQLINPSDVCYNLWHNTSTIMYMKELVVQIMTLEEYNVYLQS
jgi:hypothetical protein